MPCAYCTVSFSMLPGSPLPRRTLDHVWPRSRFHQRFDGTVLCCEPCNKEKSNLTVEEWVARMPPDDPRRERALAVLEKCPRPPDRTEKLPRRTKRIRPRAARRAQHREMSLTEFTRKIAAEFAAKFPNKDGKLK